jgi:signal transduction histidine kinase/CheY-like chemotaxis protein/methyl-accepting chemotaxis protein
MTDINSTSQFNVITNIPFFYSLRGKLTLLLLSVSLVPLIIVTLLIYQQAQQSLQEAAVSKLIALRDIKSHQIASYLEERLGDMKILSQSPATATALRAFDQAVHDRMETLGTDETDTMNYYRSLYLGKPNLNQADDDSTYSTVHAQYHSMFKEHMQTYGYYDVFLIELHMGNIIYSAEKKDDFGTSLLKGTYANTNISKVFQQAVVATTNDFTWLGDFAYYEPSQKAAAFMSSPIFDGNKLIGVLIVQLPTNQVNAIMQERAGLGETGETLLVSTKDFLLRSDSRFSDESTLFKQKFDNEVTRAAAAGETGVKTAVDYRGKLTLNAYTPLQMSGVQWLLNAKIDQAEAAAAAQDMLTKMLIIMGGGTVIIMVIAVGIGNSIAKPIRMMIHIAHQLANGDMNLPVKIVRRDEIGMMAIVFRQMVTNLQQVIGDIVQISQGLAAGNLEVTPNIEYKGDFIQIKNALASALSNQKIVIEDIVQVSQGLAEGHLGVKSQACYQGDFIQIEQALETALANLREVIADIVQISKGLAAGGHNVSSQAAYQGDFIQVKQTLEAAATQLATATSQNVTQNWLKTGQTQLNDQMSGDQNIVELTHNIVSFLTLYLDAQLGVCYLIEDGADHQVRNLKLTASYAQTGRKNLAEEFQFSEGLVHRAAREQKTIILTIDAGLTEAVPRHLVVMPFLHETTVKGVLVIGRLEALSEVQLDFFHQVMPSIGVAVNSVESRGKMAELLQQTQLQAQELQNQQAELQHTNEELQSQSEELQNQAEELQTQTEELRQSNETLEERSRELEKQKTAIRDKNLALEQTQQAIETKAQELELASKYKSEFLANMSHELRTPLNSLLILSQLLAENKTGNLDVKQMEYAQTIHSAGSDLLTLINEILDLSKVEAGKVEIHREEVSLMELIKTIQHKFQPLAEEKGFKFHVNLIESLPTNLNTDKQRLKQIINNLLSNAFKFTSAGKVQLQIQRPTHDEVVQMGLVPSQTLAIRVSDTGIGIPKDKQQVIFEAFQQVDGTTSRRYGGTGLGLSISRQLARLLGGDIQLWSEEGQGSAFTLYLPETAPISSAVLPDSSSVQTAVANSETTVPTEAPLSLVSTPSNTANLEPISDDRADLEPTDQSILIIEDDRKFSKILLELAREKAFKGLIAEDGRTGLQLAETYQPNAIILDVGLPQLDGWSVMEKLKDNPQTRHIPVHFMSAVDQHLDAKKMGAIGYLLKPVNMVELKAAFKNIEQFLAKTVKNLLVISDNEQHQQHILALVNGTEIQTTLVKTITAARQQLENASHECVIFDAEIEQGTGLEQLESIKTDEPLTHLPLIIYANRDLNPTEEAILQRMATHLTVKAVRSPERLLDEATLFLHQVEAKLPEDKRNMIRMVHDKATILKHKKVLIVDDDMRNIFALASILENHEMEITIGKNGKEALTLLEQQGADIILMDIMMPEMDGYEAMQTIRQQPRFRKLPIIALTAKAMKGDKAKCIGAGANDYLSKPVDTEKLISLMRVWLYQ